MLSSLSTCTPGASSDFFTILKVRKCQMLRSLFWTSDAFLNFRVLTLTQNQNLAFRKGMSNPKLVPKLAYGLLGVWTLVLESELAGTSLRQKSSWTSLSTSLVDSSSITQLWFALQSKINKCANWHIFSQHILKERHSSCRFTIGTREKHNKCSGPASCFIYWEKYNKCSGPASINVQALLQ